MQPFLSQRARERRMPQGEGLRNWSTYMHDWANAIWSGECVFSAGDICGTTLIAYRPGEEYGGRCLATPFAH